MVRAVGALVTEQSQQWPKARSIQARGNAPGKARSASQNKGLKARDTAVRAGFPIWDYFSL
jgi:hypothetical protein